MSTSPPSESPDPWSQPPTTIELSTTPPDLLASPAEEAAERPRRRRAPILIAVAAVVALLLGGAAYAGARLWYGTGAQPEEATPSSVVAFVRLDLSPGYGQRLAVNNLLKKFPQDGDKDTVDSLKEGVFEALDIEDAAYREHVKPWFADRIGIGLWLDDKKRPYGLATLAVKDDAGARAGLAELQRDKTSDKFGFVLRDGYALVANGDQDAQAAAEAAGKDADRETLAAAERFRRGLEWLPARQTALAWVDAEAVGAALKSLMPEAMGGSPDGGPDRLGLLFPGMNGLEKLGEMKGQVIVGGQATDNGVEIRFRSFDTGMAAQTGPADARSTVDALPGNSSVAAAFRVPDGIAESSGKPATGAGELPEELAAWGEGVAALAGAKLSFTLASLDDDDPKFAATAETTSADKAEALARVLKLFGDAMALRQSGNSVTLETPGYAAGGGKLGEQALYREALDGAPAEATGVVYADVQRLVAESDMTDKERAEAKPVKAIGLAYGVEDGESVGLLRIVIK